MSIRRVIATTDVSRIDYVSGVVRGYRYVNTYTHPSPAQTDPSALAALTSFCTETAPPGATPPPATRTPPTRV